MEQLGERMEAGEGFHLDDLIQMKASIEAAGATCRMIDLGRDAHVLVISDGIRHLSCSHDDILNEQKALEWDKKAWMYGRVVNKKARWNLCYGEADRDPDYEAKKGRIIGWDGIPLTHRLVEQIGVMFGGKARGLQMEGNYYYDNSKCGIGYHGDTERRKVIGVRLGASLPIHFQWYHRNQPIGDNRAIELNGGDIYMMSEKAVGTDWKSSSIHTLRHAVGADKFTKTI
jgi:hypothetical protein